MELSLFVGIEHILSRKLSRLIHPHVQTPTEPSRKASTSFINLMGGNTQISQDSIHLLDSVQPEIPLDISEIGLNQGKPAVFRCICKRISVLVKRIQMPFIQMF